MFRTAFILIVLIILQSPVWGQVASSGIPYSYQFQLSPVKDYTDMPLVNMSELKVKDSQKAISGLKNRRFAVGLNADDHPYNSGEWQSVANGGKVWRLGIRSSGAYSIYLVFGKFHLEKGVSLFIYNKDYSDMNGPITSAKNNKNDILPVPPIPGDEIVIELNISSEVENFGELTLTKVWHDYTNKFGKSRQKSLKSSISGTCNIGINCPLGLDWQIEKKAVCKLIANGELCTGTLINNVKDPKIPYLLTAFHCVEDEAIAATALFYFDYEEINCTTTDQTVPKIIEGATLVATTPNQLDFSLLRLNQNLPASYNTYMAGWETTTNPNNYFPIGGICIHHPQGDVKKISIENDSLLTGNFGEGFNSYSHWWVRKWDNGVTEGGSSGAPLFNKYHRLIGTLTGGSSACGNPIDDYFTKFLLAWDYYPEKNKQLKAWLDPDNTGVTKLEGYSPYGLYHINYDSISNITATDSLILSDRNMAWGYISGQNSQNWQQYAEKFTPTDSTFFDQVYFQVAKAINGNALSNIQLKIWTGNDIPETEIISKLIFIKDLQSYSTNIFYLDTLLKIKGNFFIGYSVNYTEPADTFALYNAMRKTAATSTMYVMQNNLWWNINDLPGNDATSLGIGYIGIKKVYTFINKPAIVKYNFSLSSVKIDTQNKIEEVKLFRCFDITGKEQKIFYTIDDTYINISTTNLRQGIYIYQLITNNKKYTGKFAVFR
jgi:hypothetical protein